MEIGNIRCISRGLPNIHLIQMALLAMDNRTTPVIDDDNTVDLLLQYQSPQRMLLICFIAYIIYFIPVYWLLVCVTKLT